MVSSAMVFGEMGLGEMVFGAGVSDAEVHQGHQPAQLQPQSS